MEFEFELGAGSCTGVSTGAFLTAAGVAGALGIVVLIVDVLDFGISIPTCLIVVAGVDTGVSFVVTGAADTGAGA